MKIDNKAHWFLFILGCVVIAYFGFQFKAQAVFIAGGIFMIAQAILLLARKNYYVAQTNMKWLWPVTRAVAYISIVSGSLIVIYFWFVHARIM